MDPSWFPLVKFNESHLHLNPALNKEIKLIAQEAQNLHLKEKGPLIWIMSSGTTSTNESSFKLIGLSEKALMVSAEAVNKHLEVIKDDRWLNVLPLFHVGGLSILYRSMEAQIDCINLWNEAYRWNPLDFANELKINQVTLTSIVPTQVFDLVKNQIHAPKNLRIVLVGGGQLNENLYESAKKLGWPLLTTFGMTEASSQVATSSLNTLQSLDRGNQNPTTFVLLSHIEASVDNENRLSLSSSSLLDGFYPIYDGVLQNWVDPKSESGWYLTHDRADLKDKNLTILSRMDDLVKIRGENVNLSSLRNRLYTLLTKENLSNSDLTIISIPDERLGQMLLLVGDLNINILESIRSSFNEASLPFERIEKSIGPISIPKNALGKIQNQKLLQIIDD